MPILLPATVDSKPLFVKECGEEIVDLTRQSLKYTQPQLMTSYLKVPEDFAMRVDLIANVTLGSTSQIEKILKFNDISNPFTIDTGDIIFVPDLFIANQNLRVTSNDKGRKQDIRNQYIDPAKASKLDPNLEKFDKREKPKPADPSKTAPPLPPNFANIGDKEIEIKGGKIFFGPNVSKNGNECDQPLTKSEFLAKLIKNRLKK